MDEQWKRFQQELEDEKQIQAQKKSKWPFKKNSAKSTDLVIEGEDSPTAKDIIEAVQAAESQWREKERLGHGQVQKRFHSFCRFVGRHKAMLDMLPSQNQYFSVLCGSITTLIKVRHSMGRD